MFWHSTFEAAGPVDEFVTSTGGLAGHYEDPSYYLALDFSALQIPADSLAFSAFNDLPSPYVIWPEWYASSAESLAQSFAVFDNVTLSVQPVIGGDTGQKIAAKRNNDARRLNDIRKALDEFNETSIQASAASLLQGDRNVNLVIDRRADLLAANQLQAQIKAEALARQAIQKAQDQARRNKSICFLLLLD